MILKWLRKRFIGLSLDIATLTQYVSKRILFYFGVNSYLTSNLHFW